MKPHGLLISAALATAVLLSGCVEFDAGARSRLDAPEGDCWASQGPSGQSAGCGSGGSGCQVEQSWAGQSGSCRHSG